MTPKLKRIISLHYPASRLPPNLLGEIDPTHRVTVTVAEEGPEGSEYETLVNDFSHLPHVDLSEASRAPLSESRDESHE